MSEGVLSTDNSQSAVMPSTWKTPDEVMKLHRLRMKKKALQARMNRTESSISPLNASKTLSQPTEKRKNPFRYVIYDLYHLLCDFHNILIY